MHCQQGRLFSGGGRATLQFIRHSSALHCVASRPIARWGALERLKGGALESDLAMHCHGAAPQGGGKAARTAVFEPGASLGRMGATHCEMRRP